eukprot:gene8026-5581_t
MLSSAAVGQGTPPRHAQEVAEAWWRVPLPAPLLKFEPLTEEDLQDSSHPIRAASYPWEQVDHLWHEHQAAAGTAFGLDMKMSVLRIGRWPDLFAGELRVLIPENYTDGRVPARSFDTAPLGATTSSPRSATSRSVSSSSSSTPSTTGSAVRIGHGPSEETQEVWSPRHSAVLTKTFSCLNLNIARQILASQALLLLAPEYAREVEGSKSKGSRVLYLNAFNTRDNVFELNGQTLMEQAMELLSAAQTTRPAAEVRRYVSPDADWTKYAGQDKTLTPEFEALMAAKRAFAADPSMTRFRWTLRNVSADQLSGPRSTLSVKEESETTTHFCFAFELYCVSAGCAGVRDDADPLSMPEAFSTAMSEYVGEPLTRVIYRCLMAASKQLRCAGLMADLWREFSLTLCPPFLSSVHDYICFYFDAFFKQRRRDCQEFVGPISPSELNVLSARKKREASPEELDGVMSYDGVGGAVEGSWICSLQLKLKRCGYWWSLPGAPVEVPLMSDEGTKKLKTVSRVMTHMGAGCFSFLYKLTVEHLLKYNTKDEKMYDSPRKAMDGFSTVLPEDPLRRWCLEDIDSQEPTATTFPMRPPRRTGESSSSMNQGRAYEASSGNSLSSGRGSPQMVLGADGGSLEAVKSRLESVLSQLGHGATTLHAGAATERSVVQTLYRRALLQRQARPGGYLSPTSRVMALLLEWLCRPFYECAVLCREYAVVDPQRTAERALLESYLQQCRNQRALSGLSRPPGATQRDRFESAIYVARGDGFAPGGAPRRSQGDSIARESDAARTKRVAEAAVFSFVGHGATFEESFQRAAAKALVVVTSYRQMRMEQDFIIAADELDSSVPPPVPRAPVCAAGEPAGPPGGAAAEAVEEDEEGGYDMNGPSAVRGPRPCVLQRGRTAGQGAAKRHSLSNNNNNNKKKKVEDTLCFFVRVWVCRMWAERGGTHTHSGDGDIAEELLFPFFFVSSSFFFFVFAAITYYDVPLLFCVVVDAAVMIIFRCEFPAPPIWVVVVLNVKSVVSASLLHTEEKREVALNEQKRFRCTSFWIEVERVVLSHVKIVTGKQQQQRPPLPPKKKSQ